MGEKAILSQRGGVWIPGGAFLTWPFARLDVLPDRLEISHARYYREQIVSLRRKRGRSFGSGLEIVHNKYGKHQTVVFWPLDFGTLQLALQRCSYDVKA